MLEAIICAFTVSIDGFISGFAFGSKNIKINLKKLFIISIIPIIMSMPIMFIGNYLNKYISCDISKYLSFILFIILAITSLKQINNNKENNINLLNSIIIGITIGIDSSVSAFSLAINNHNPIITPFYFGIFHGILIFFGNKLSLNNKLNNIFFIKYISPILFTVLAVQSLI